MTRFLILRHGETGITDRIPGRTPNIPLSSSGRKQAEDLAEMLRDYPFELIISSPIQRTIETAEIISARFNKKIIINEAFTEIDFGKWTWLTREELDKIKEWKLFNTFRSNTQIPGGEIFTEVQERVVKGVKKLAAEYPSKTVVIVSHGDPIKTLLSYYLGIPLDLILRFNVSTASLSILDLEHSGVQINGINLVSHPH